MDTQLRFECAAGHEDIYEAPASQCTYDPRPCSECGAEATYVGMVPRDLGLTGKVAYDQNGRLAYKISDGKGGSTYISKTKYDYLQTGVVKPAYTKDYERHVVASGDAQSLEGKDLTKMKRRPSGGIRELMKDASAKDPTKKARG